MGAFSLIVVINLLNRLAICNTMSLALIKSYEDDDEGNEYQEFLDAISLPTFTFFEGQKRKTLPSEDPSTTHRTHSSICSTYRNSKTANCQDSLKTSLDVYDTIVNQQANGYYVPALDCDNDLSRKRTQASIAVAYKPEQEPVSVADEKSDKIEAKRVRTFDHEVGNWCSFFYVSYPNSEELISILKPHLDEFESKGFYLCKDFHISLSRTIVLKHFMINAVFLSMKPILMGLNSTQCLLAGVKPYENEEKTTSFLSVSVVSGCNLLNKIIDTIDKEVCDIYKFPHFYKNRDLHMSVFWKNGPIDEQSHEMSSRLDQILDQFTAEQGSMYFSAVYDDLLTFDIEEIVFKSGCKIMELPLNC